MSSEEVEVKFGSKREEKAVENGGGERKSKKDGLVKWEKFLPRMVLRVLLVEADDSTRQIIAALLRKCSYRGQYVSIYCNSFPFSFDYRIARHRGLPGLCLAYHDPYLSGFFV